MGDQSQLHAMTPTAIYSQEPARGRLPWGAVAPLLAVVFVAVPLLGVSWPLERIGLLDVEGDPIGLIGLFAFLILPFAAIGLVVIAWVYFIERRPLATIGLVGSDGPGTFLRGYLVGVATIFAVVAAIWSAGGFMAQGYGNALASSGALLSIGFLLGCFAIQAGVEEILFRGWLLSLIARRFNVGLAVTLTSIVFCFLHFSPHQPWLVTFNLLLFSVFACFWALRAGNIWGVMGWHAGWNWLLATGFELPVTGLELQLPALLIKMTANGPDYLTGGAQGPEGSVYCTLFFTAAIAWLIWRASRSANPDAPAGRAIRGPRAT